MNGKISYISTDVIYVVFPTGGLPQIGTILKTTSGSVLSVEAIKSEKEIIAVIINRTGPLKINETVKSTGKPIQAPVGKEGLGRIFNVLGQPIDNKKLSSKQKFVDAPVYKTSNKDFVVTNKLLETGIKVIDFFIPVMEGNKIGMFGGAGVGKTLVIKEIISNITTKNTKKLSSIFVGIGERSREGEELYRELTEDKLIDQVMLYFAQMNETPGARMKLIYSAIASAEYFRDVMKQDTLMFIDNIYRFTQAGSELSSSLGNIPSQSGYQPTLMTEIANVEERLSNSSTGSITSFQTVFVPADDITDPATVNIFSHLDGSLVLDRAIAAAGRYPAISPLQSSSNNLLTNIVGKKHVEAVMNVKKYLQRFEELEDLIAILGIDGISDKDKVIVERARKVSNYFTQDFHTAEIFTQRKGAFVKLEDTIDSVERILGGEFDDVDPTNFLYIKTVDDIKRKEKEETTVKLSKKELKASLKKQKKTKNEETKNEETKNEETEPEETEPEETKIEETKIEETKTKETKTKETKTKKITPKKKQKAKKK